MVERVADSDVGVLLRGESGVGKEVIARELHRRSPRRTKPFVKVNCAALPADLLESELFGHERGAFTGAGTTRIGKFEFAQGGTIMLDEIGEMPGALQAKLLHVLQDRELTRLGSNRPIEVDVRVLAATNRDPRGDDAERHVPRGPVLPPPGDRAAHPAAARAARGDPVARRVLPGEVRGRLPPPGGAAQPRAARGAGGLPVAGQHPRAREHDEAVRRAAGGVAGARRARAPAAGGAGRATGGTRHGCARAGAGDVAAGGRGGRRAPCPADGGRAAAPDRHARAAGRGRSRRRSGGRQDRRRRWRGSAGAGPQRGDEGRARGHRSGAGEVPLEPPQGGGPT